MMKKQLLSLLCLLSAMTATAATSSPSGLSVDSISINGNFIAQLSQHVEISIRNTSDTDFEGRLYMLALNKSDGSLTPSLDTLVSIKASKSLWFTLYPTLPEGDLELRLATDADGQQVIGSSNVAISPLRKLNFNAVFSLDMLSETDTEKVLYGSRIRGWMRVSNYDAPYYGAYGGTADDDGFVLWLEDSDNGEILFKRHLCSMLPYYNWVQTSFAHDAVFRDGAHYKLKVGYGMPYGLETIDSLCFTTRRGINTYWTADGQVLPLPLLSDGQLLVPAEAVAVDLRGQNAINTVFSLDASQANPNCLYYLDIPDNVPQGLDESHNIVRGMEAAKIILTEGNDFYCPLAFRARFVSYLMTPSYNNPDAEACRRGYSETIVLPFAPSSINLYDVNGGTDMLHPDMLKVLEYYGNIGDSLNISVISSIQMMEAYKPYILGVYVGSSLLFIGENTVIPMTGEAIVRGNGLDFMGTTVSRRLSPQYYVYSPDDYSFRRGDDDVIEPFHACLYATKAVEPEGGSALGSLGISDYVWGSKGRPGDSTISGLQPTTRGSEKSKTVYSTTGCQMDSRHLSKGIYIIDGRKFIVK
ncbi:MAG: hypothetical protein K6G08_10555 [Prevotella sp.]|nr:hypothetical protein [Prevotella sp.]